MMLKKLAVLGASLALTIAMAAPSFAATVPDQGGVIETTDTTVIIEKGIDFINDAAIPAAGPGIEYTYTVAPATVAANTTITDSQNHVGTVHSGPASGLTITATPSFPKSESYTTSAAGTESVKNLQLEVDLTKFDRAGIYRYVLTDTTTQEALDAAGIIRAADYDNVKYVDVYITGNNKGSLAVSGYVVGSDIDTNGVLEKGDFDNDKYKTYNVTLEKEVTGNMGDRDNEFPFDVTVENGQRFYFVKENAAPTGLDAEKIAAGANPSGVTLKHGDKLYIYGLSPKATVAYVETNNTHDNYTTSIAGADSQISAASLVNAGTTKAMTAAAITDYDSAAGQTAAAALTNVRSVKYTNNLEEVNPTGVVLRYGPYLALLALGILLLALRRKTKLEK